MFESKQVNFIFMKWFINIYNIKRKRKAQNYLFYENFKFMT